MDICKCNLTFISNVPKQFNTVKIFLIEKSEAKLMFRIIFDTVTFCMDSKLPLLNLLFVFKYDR